jgi:hypothetical protein
MDYQSIKSIIIENINKKSIMQQIFKTIVWLFFNQEFKLIFLLIK